MKKHILKILDILKTKNKIETISPFFIYHFYSLTHKSFCFKKNLYMTSWVFFQIWPEQTRIKYMTRSLTTMYISWNKIMHFKLLSFLDILYCFVFSGIGSNHLYVLNALSVDFKLLFNSILWIKSIYKVSRPIGNCLHCGPLMFIMLVNYSCTF